MRNPLLALLDIWQRRYWRTDPEALGRLGGGRPGIVITGASEGIGLALAERFATTGSTLLLVARGEAALTAAAEGLARRSAVEAIALPLDITTPDAVDRIADALARHGLYADVLINNAGIGLSGPFTGHEPAEVARMVDTNVRALSLLTRRFLPDMCVRGRGGVINVASLGGYAPGPDQAAYYASKSYVISLTRAVAYETRGLGVRVMVVSPGPVDTRFHAKMGSDTALYRYLIRGMSAERVADAAWHGWRWGLGVVRPGLSAPILALAMTLLPGVVLTPIIGLLLRRPGVGSGTGSGGGPTTGADEGQDARRS
jgi:short-subunit dehydrogenase